VVLFLRPFDFRHARHREQSMPQSLSRVYLHTVFSTKDRHPFFTSETEIADVHSYIGGIVKTLACEPIRVGGIADHVHLLSTLSRTKTIAEFIKETKRVSSNWIQELGTGYKRFSWQAGYGCFSVSEMELDQIVEYIDNQEDHHRLIDFKEEYRKLLRDHGIEYDERHVWD